MEEPRYPSRDTWRPLAVAAAAAVAVGLGVWLLQPSSFALGEDGQDGEAESHSPALETARQKKTIGQIRTIGNAYMSWLTDQVGAASAGAQKTISLETNDARLLTPEEVRADLRPSDTFFYLDEISLEDAWGHSLEVWRGSNYLYSRVLLIRSPGSDGEFEGEEYEAEAFPATDFNRDIVWADGYFIQFPENAGKD